MFQVYQPSGRFSPLALVLVPVMFVGVVAVAYVYQLGLYWIPFIYINCLLTWGMAMVIGKATEFVVTAGHVRNVALSLFVFAILVVAGLGAKFGFQYLDARTTLQNELANLSQRELGIETDPPLTSEEMVQVREAILADFTFADHIQMRVENGWNIGRGGGGRFRDRLFIWFGWWNWGSFFSLGERLPWTPPASPTAKNWIVGRIRSPMKWLCRSRTR